MNIICFHNPDEENGYLSNGYRCVFEVNGIIFSSMEQFMMYKKAECFRDHLISHQILETDDVAEIKSLGRQVTGDDDHIWNGMRQIIVYEGLLAKFSQNDGANGFSRMCGKGSNMGNRLVHERSKAL